MKKATLLFTLVTTLTLGITLSAQEKLGPDTYIPVEEAAKLGQLPSGFPVDVYQRVPKGCPRGARPYIITRNAGTGTTPSTQLMAVMSQNTYRPAPRAYGETGIDKWFVDTLPLGSCKICAGFLIADLVNEGGLSTNDGFTIWTGDPSPIYGPGMALIKPLFLHATSSGSGAVAGKPSLWGPPVTSTKTLSLNLNVAGRISDAPTTNDFAGLPVLNNYIFTTTGTPTLDVFLSDDTTIRSLQLVVWR
jgi:hypothetical protein